MYRPEQLQIARMQVDVTYNAAFLYWSLKGALAERWGHGPTFSGFADLGNQVNLSPGPDANRPGLVAYYGILQSGFNAEPVTDRAADRELALRWAGDVIEVLKPQRVVRLYVNLFCLYPTGNAEVASARLTERYYRRDRVAQVLPEAWPGSRHHAIEGIVVDGDENRSVVVGVVGPPHRGSGYFMSQNPDRDGRWWIGLRYIRVVANEAEGIEDPRDRLALMLNDADGDIRDVADRVLRNVV